MSKRKSRRTKLYPYKSDLEKRLHEGSLKETDYEPGSVEYTIPKKYTPDFVTKDGSIWFEAKGRFQNYGEVQKYTALKRAYPEQRIIFIFSDPKKRAYAQCRRRKDGTFLTMQEWAETNGFEWYTEHTIPKELINDDA